MARRLDIGVCAFGRPDLLQNTLDGIVRTCTTDWRVIVVDNPHPVDGYATASCNIRVEDVIIRPPLNIGYAGAVRRAQERAETEYIAYLDHDVSLLTPGWDETLCSLLDRHHEVGLVFPNGGAYPIDRGDYQEVMWSPGFAWVLSRLCMSETGLFDTTLGHQEECDYALRIRMAGWRCAAVPSVRVDHLANATNDPSPESSERIAKGVRAFVDKWNRYFNGKNFNYHSPNVTRWDDWPPNALYLEEYWKLRTPDLNANPEPYAGDDAHELLRVPRLKSFYNSRII